MKSIYINDTPKENMFYPEDYEVDDAENKLLLVLIIKYHFKTTLNAT